MYTSDRKAVFFDLDGTLVDENNQVPHSAAQAIRRLRANGHLAFINTGRTLVSVGEHIRQVGFDGCVCACGSRVYLNEEEIFVQTLPSSKYADIIRILRRMKAPVFFEGPDRVYFDPHNEGNPPELIRCREYFTWITQGKVLDMPLDPEDDSILFDKFLCVFQPGTDISLLQDFVKDDFLSILHAGGQFEVTARGCSKALGIQVLSQRLGLTPQNCYGVGDSANDLEMFKAVGHSIAMGNSAQVVLPYAEFVTGTVEEDGILHALEHYGLI